MSASNEIFLSEAFLILRETLDNIRNSLRSRLALPCEGFAEVLLIRITREAVPKHQEYDLVEVMPGRQLLNVEPLEL